jgi:hypothetical protein
MASQFLIKAHNRNDYGLYNSVEGVINKELCFFLKRELGKTKSELKESGHYQHVKMSRNRQSGFIEFLEYASSKIYYKTLEDWLQTTGCTLDDVLYGRQDFNGIGTHITLAALLHHLGYVTEHTAEPQIDDLTRLFVKLRTNSVPINQIMVPKTVMVPGDVYLME